MTVEASDTQDAGHPGHEILAPLPSSNVRLIQRMMRAIRGQGGALSSDERRDLAALLAWLAPFAASEARCRDAGTDDRAQLADLVGAFGAGLTCSADAATFKVAGALLDLLRPLAAECVAPISVEGQL